MEALTYDEVGATAGVLPDGYHHLRLRRVVGHGRPALERAGAALLSGQVHRRAGLSFEADVVPLRVDAEVRMRLGVGPVGIDAPCRVVWVEDGPRRHGFAYGTLPGHPECGEQRFEVVLEEQDRVTFVITAFSRPGSRLTRLGGPLARTVQRGMARRYLEACAQLASA